MFEEDEHLPQGTVPVETFGVELVDVTPQVASDCASPNERSQLQDGPQMAGIGQRRNSSARRNSITGDLELARALAFRVAHSPAGLEWGVRAGYPLGGEPYTPARARRQFSEHTITIPFDGTDLCFKLWPVSISVARKSLDAGIDDNGQSEEFICRYGFAAGGIPVQEVPEHSVAQVAGLLAGDVIVSVNGKSLVGLTTDEALQEFRAGGGLLSLSINRDPAVEVLRLLLQGQPIPDQITLHTEGDPSDLTICVRDLKGRHLPAGASRCSLAIRRPDGDLGEEKHTESIVLPGGTRGSEARWPGHVELSVPVAAFLEHSLVVSVMASKIPFVFKEVGKVTIPLARIGGDSEGWHKCSDSPVELGAKVTVHDEHGALSHPLTLVISSRYAAQPGALNVWLYDRVGMRLAHVQGSERSVKVSDVYGNTLGSVVQVEPEQWDGGPAAYVLLDKNDRSQGFLASEPQRYDHVAGLVASTMCLEENPYGLKASASMLSLDSLAIGSGFADVCPTTEFLLHQENDVQVAKVRIERGSLLDAGGVLATVARGAVLPCVLTAELSPDHDPAFGLTFAGACMALELLFFSPEEACSVAAVTAAASSQTSLL
eukprot:CAMPEP_0114544718 /NCGR_PEP_ID=MMETSP0114-20121206/3022_1 /TAXON_ID=31324 /ORGANISM="Goniomonas sp, Strain m" /LENGTH=601 /DNA_ID=CAMNT_0001729109 /DNA_START=9 /DNA_END=1814 /DNA_ORIENTATION=-